MGQKESLNGLIKTYESCPVAFIVIRSFRAMPLQVSVGGMGFITSIPG